MCAVSLVVAAWTDPMDRNYMPAHCAEPDVAQQMLDVIERLEQLDKRLGLRECAMDRRAKTAFKKALKKRVDSYQSK